MKQTQSATNMSLKMNTLYTSHTKYCKCKNKTCLNKFPGCLAHRNFPLNIICCIKTYDKVVLLDFLGPPKMSLLLQLQMPSLIDIK